MLENTISLDGAQTIVLEKPFNSWIYVQDEIIVFHPNPTQVLLAWAHGYWYFNQLVPNIP